MNTIKLVMLSAVFAVTTGSAVAHSPAGSAEQSRLNSEMNKPATGEARNSRSAARMTPPVSQTDRRAEEFRKNTEMMKPSTYDGSTAAARSPDTVPLKDEDRKVADTMQRTERMKPN